MCAHYRWGVFGDRFCVTHSVGGRMPIEFPLQVSLVQNERSFRASSVAHPRTAPVVPPTRGGVVHQLDSIRCVGVRWQYERRRRVKLLWDSSLLHDSFRVETAIKSRTSGRRGWRRDMRRQPIECCLAAVFLCVLLLCYGCSACK